MTEDHWESLYRRLPTEVKENWEVVEREVAEHLGIQLGSKLETPGAWVALYTALTEHFLQSRDNAEFWENF